MRRAVTIPEVIEVQHRPRGRVDPTDACPNPATAHVERHRLTETTRAADHLCRTALAGT